MKGSKILKKLEFNLIENKGCGTIITNGIDFDN